MNHPEFCTSMSDGREKADAAYSVSERIRGLKKLEARQRTGAHCGAGWVRTRHLVSSTRAREGRATWTRKTPGSMLVNALENHVLGK